MDINLELEKVSAKITSVIKADDYPAEILPEPLKQAVLEYPLNAGKRLRPALTLWCCGLLNGDLKKAVYPAAGIEVYHNWTLVHDDIIDQDALRRNKPTAHVALSNYAKSTYKLKTKDSHKFGNDFAILTGDLQQSWAISLMTKSIKNGVPANIILSLIKDLTDTVSRELISGEAIDTEMSYKNIDKVTSEEVEEMIYLKTASLLSFSTVTGAKIALNTDNKKDKRILKLADYASALGIAFQLKDDWLGIFSDTTQLGKPVGSDITAAKPTSLILTALKKLNDNDQQKLKSFLGKNISKDDLSSVRELIQKSKSEEITLQKINNLHAYAEKCLKSFHDNKYRKILLELNHFLKNRNK